MRTLCEEENYCHVLFHKQEETKPSITLKDSSNNKQTGYVSLKTLLVISTLLFFKMKDLELEELSLCVLRFPGI